MFFKFINESLNIEIEKKINIQNMDIKFLFEKLIEENDWAFEDLIIAKWNYVNLKYQYGKLTMEFEEIESRSIGCNYDIEDEMENDEMDIDEMDDVDDYGNKYSDLEYDYYDERVDDGYEDEYWECM